MYVLFTLSRIPMPSFFQRAKNFINGLSRRTIIISAIVAAIVILIIYKSAHKTPPATVEATIANVVEEVTLSGSVKSASAVDLAFADGGRISRVLVSEGDHVKKGQLLAQVDIADLAANLRDARAALDIARATKSSNATNLETVTNQQNTLVQNAYNALLNSSITAYPNSSWSLNETAPVISGTYLLGREGTIEISTYGSGAATGVSFSTKGLVETVGQATDVSSQPIGNSGLTIQFPKPKAGLEWIISIPNKQASNYVTNYNAYQAAKTARDQAIAAAESSVIANGGSSISDAQIAQAQARIDSINAQIARRSIYAPFDGIVANMNLKPGATVSVSATAGASSTITLLSDSDYQAVLKVPELSVGKLSVGQHVDITLDAYGSDVAFPGTILSIDPAETIVDGVPVYQTKVAFDQNDDRIRSGMTATAKIVTGQKDGVVAIPASAIQTDKDGTFVVVRIDDKESKRRIKTGLRGSDSMVEITEGVTAGDRIVTPTN